MFGCLMLVDMALFAFLAYRYTYVKIHQNDAAEDDLDTGDNNNDLERIPMDEKPSKSE